MAKEAKKLGLVRNFRLPLRPQALYFYGLEEAVSKEVIELAEIGFRNMRNCDLNDVCKRVDYTMLSTLLSRHGVCLD